MVTRPANTPTHTQTHNPFLLYLGLQSCISYALLAPHTHCTRKQKSILSTSQCHHNYSFETAIENKLHLHCVFIRLLWVSNAQQPGLSCLCQRTDLSLKVYCPYHSVANNWFVCVCLYANLRINTAILKKYMQIKIKDWKKNLVASQLHWNISVAFCREVFPFTKI